VTLTDTLSVYCNNITDYPENRRKVVRGTVWRENDENQYKSD